MANDVTRNTVESLSRRSATRTEADIQASIQTLLIAGDLNLDADEAIKVEDQLADGTRRRIDVSVCHAVIEVKKDLRNPSIRADGVTQVEGYVSTRRQQFGRRFVGILTDGVVWVLFDHVNGVFTEIDDFTNDGDADRLLVWLEAILASQEQVKPTPRDIEQRLGAESPAHLLDVKELTALWEAHRSQPELELKRQLWAKLLRTAFGESFTDDDAIFINHTLLVLIAEAIAHAVVGLDPSTQVTPDDLVTGRSFDAMGIHGVVESDFFDWIVAVPDGHAFVTALAARIAKFDWTSDALEHDVLKHLYESIISQETRESLGEYYTPDWLADRIVAASVSSPLDQRVLDPACGSGTFVFHAVRTYLAAADEAGVPITESVSTVTTHVIGMDVHPVAVTLARVTYLLAMGNERLSRSDRPEISIPIYLGDSLQWEQDPSLFSRDDAFSVDTTGDHLTGSGGGMLFENDLVFPLAVLTDAAKFDGLVSRMADLALDDTGTHNKTLILPALRQFNITDETVRETLIQTFTVMRDLARSGRNHIWGYYARNLIRPVWLALPDNRVDVLVGNPPWLRYSKMTPAMQERYLALARPRNLLTGPLGASGRDLSTLFVVRAVEKYLNPGGSFAFVMPHGTLTRLPHTGFRSGDWASSSVGDLAVQWGRSWDLNRAPTGFPMTSCVVVGTYAEPAKPMTTTVDAWASTVAQPEGTWDQMGSTFIITERQLTALDAGIARPVSPYKTRFRDGAILYPRVLVTVEDAPALPFGAGAGRRRVQSRRTAQEKRPWNLVESIRETVETEHIYPVYLGESVAHYRVLDPIAGVLPLASDRLLTSSQIAEHSGLAKWWGEAEGRWDAKKVANDDSALLTRIDFHGQLSAQLPQAPHRVVYTKSGSNLAAARVEDERGIIDHKLYWAPVVTVAEGRYLVGILNSQTLLDRVRPLQNVGLFGPRDFDKNVFSVPFGSYDSTNADHTRLVELVAEAEALAAGVVIVGAYRATRTAIKRALTEAGLAQQIEDAVNAILPVLE